MNEWAKHFLKQLKSKRKELLSENISCQATITTNNKKILEYDELITTLERT